VDSSGNVGIGTNSPNADLELGGAGEVIRLSGSSTNAYIRNTDGTTNQWYIGSGGAAGLQHYIYQAQPMTFHTDGTERMRIDASGNVGIGTTSMPAGRRLVVSGGNIRLDTDYQIEWGGSTVGLYGHGANNTLHFFTNTTERLRIDSSGNLLVGTTSLIAGSDARLQADGGGTYGALIKSGGDATKANTTLWHVATTGNNAFMDFGTQGSFTSRGSITYNRGGGLVAYNTTSDYRAKDIAGAISDASSTVLSLKPYMGTMKGAEIARPMFVAHETQEIAPYAVTGQKDAVDSDGNAVYQQMDHSALVPLLTAALQEALTEIASLKARLDAANL
jgi:hypothetical protein